MGAIYKYENSIAKYRFDLRLSLSSLVHLSHFPSYRAYAKYGKIPKILVTLLVAEMYKECLKMQTLH